MTARAVADPTSTITPEAEPGESYEVRIGFTARTAADRDRMVTALTVAASEAASGGRTVACQWCEGTGVTLTPPWLHLTPERGETPGRAGGVVPCACADSRTPGREPALDGPLSVALYPIVAGATERELRTRSLLCEALSLLAAGQSAAAAGAIAQALGDSQLDGQVSPLIPMPLEEPPF